MHGHKNIPSANPLFSGIIMTHPILHISTIRVKIRKTSSIKHEITGLGIVFNIISNYIKNKLYIFF